MSKRKSNLNKFINKSRNTPVVPSKIREGGIPKNSNWFISINPNKSPYNKDGSKNREYIDRFQDVFNEFLDNIDRFVSTKKGFTRLDDRNYSAEPTIEVGGKFKRLGAHLMLEIDHNSRIFLNYDKIRDYFRTNLTDGGDINLYVELYHREGYTNRDKIRSYIQKTFGDDFEFKIGKPRKFTTRENQ